MVFQRIIWVVVVAAVAHLVGVQIVGRILLQSHFECPIVRTVVSVGNAIGKVAGYFQKSLQGRLLEIASESIFLPLGVYVQAFLVAVVSRHPEYCRFTSA